MPIASSRFTVRSDFTLGCVLPSNLFVIKEKMSGTLVPVLVLKWFSEV